MPRVFKVGRFLIYFWSSEGNPLEPVHVHITDSEPLPHTTKVWISETGRAVLCNNNSRIHPSTLHNLMSVIEDCHEEIVTRWLEHFGEIRYFI